MSKCFLVMGAGTQHFNGVYVMEEPENSSIPTYAKMHGSDVLIHTGGFWRFCELHKDISFYAIAAPGAPPDHGWEAKQGQNPAPRVQCFDSISAIPPQLREPDALQRFSLHVQGSGASEYDGIYHIRGLRRGKACYCKENASQTILFHRGWWLMNENGTGESRYGFRATDTGPFPSESATWSTKSGQAPAPKVTWVHATISAPLASSPRPRSQNRPGKSGIRYRFSPNVHDIDRDAPVVVCGSEIEGERYNESWVKVFVPGRGDRYLPVNLGGAKCMREVEETADAVGTAVLEAHQEPESKAPEIESTNSDVRSSTSTSMDVHEPTLEAGALASDVPVSEIPALCVAADSQLGTPSSEATAVPSAPSAAAQALEAHQAPIKSGRSLECACDISARHSESTCMDGEEPTVEEGAKASEVPISEIPALLDVADSQLGTRSSEATAMPSAPAQALEAHQETVKPGRSSESTCDISARGPESVMDVEEPTVETVARASEVSISGIPSLCDAAATQLGICSSEPIVAPAALGPVGLAAAAPALEAQHSAEEPIEVNEALPLDANMETVPRFAAAMEEILRMKMERQRSKEQSGENAVEVLTPRSPAVANIQIIDERLAQHFARQQQKERTGESAVSALEATGTPRAVAEQVHDEVPEAMPDTTAELELPRLLGARALDNLPVVLEKGSFKDSAPVGLVAQRRGAFQRSTTNSSGLMSTKKFIVEAPCEGLVSQRVNTINRGLSFQTVSKNHR